MSPFELPEIPKIESLGILFTLLPGLVTDMVVRALTARGKKLEATEVILYGLAYTVVVNAIWVFLKRLGSWIPTPDLVGLSICAVVLGILVSVIVNRGLAYRILRGCGVTAEAPWRTTWETTLREFRNTRGEYVLLEFRDGRRVFGGLRGFSAQQKDGHFCLERVQWLSGDSVHAEQPGLMLFSAEDVSSVQLLPRPEEDRNVRNPTNVPGPVGPQPAGIAPGAPGASKV
jgi:hypothetical protein